MGFKDCGTEKDYIVCWGYYDKWREKRFFGSEEKVKKQTSSNLFEICEKSVEEDGLMQRKKCFRTRILQHWNMFARRKKQHIRHPDRPDKGHSITFDKRQLSADGSVNIFGWNPRRFESSGPSPFHVLVLSDLVWLGKSAEDSWNFALPLK